MKCDNEELARRFACAQKNITQQQAVALKDNNEVLVGQQAIEESGLICRPFWYETDDLEGDAYADYIAMHPKFDLSIRQSVLKRLVAAQSLLPKDWQIVLKAGFRPYSVQQKVLEDLIHSVHNKHPDWTDEKVLAHARTFVSDPRVVVPPHMTGGAVDIDIISRTNTDTIDFGCPPNTDSDISYLFNTSITHEQQSNRMTLLKAMLAVEFAPLASEWWHYQYGEVYWASFYNQPATIYNIIKV